MTDGRISDARLDELLRLAERATATALTGDYEPIAAQLRAADADLDPAIRQLMASHRLAEAMALTVGCHFHWIDSGRANDGGELAELALQAAERDGAEIDDALRARTMLTASETAFRQGQQAAATMWATGAIEAARRDDPVTAALAEVSLARVAFRDGDADRIESLSRAALDRAGDDQKVQRAAYHMLAWAAYTAGSREGAIEWFERSLAVREAMNDAFGSAVELANLGDMAMESGDLRLAASSLRQALATAIRLQNLYLLNSLIGSAGALAVAAGHAEEALILLAAADAAYASTSLVPDPSTREMMDAATAEARKASTAGTADAATAAGRALSIADASARAIAACERLLASGPFTSGTRRE